MTTFLSLGGFVLLSTAAAAAENRCPDLKKIPFGEITPCAVCTASNFQEGAPLCAYCYETGTCAEVTASNLLTGVCPSANSTACASLSHMSCTWISEGTRKDVWKIPVPFTHTTVTHEATSDLNGTCQSVLSAETKHYELTNSDGDLLISLDTTTTVKDYFWGQCAISGEKFAVLLVGACVLGLAICVTASMCYCACARRKRQKQYQQQKNMVYYAAPSDQLLGGAPVV